MREIIIVGASDVFDLVQSVYGGAEWVITGYCGFEPIDRSRYRDFRWLGPDIAATIRGHSRSVAAVIAVFDNASRRAITEQVLAAGGEILSVVHPNTVIFPTAELGRGVLVQPFVTVSTQARVEDGTYLSYGCLVGHDVSVGAFSFIAPGARLLGEAKVGEGALIGANAVLFPRVEVGAGARITAGAVVRRNVPAGATVVISQHQRLLDRF